MANETRHDIAVVRSPSPPGEGARSVKTPTFNPLDEVERLFERLAPVGWNWPLRGGFPGRGQSTRTPQLDIIDRDREMVVRAEVPGVDKKDLHISANDSTLCIRGEVNLKQVEQRQDFVRCEITRGNFSRSLSMPDGIDTTAISATLSDGILEIILPKYPGQQRRSVEVR